MVKLQDVERHVYKSDQRFTRELRGLSIMSNTGESESMNTSLLARRGRGKKGLTMAHNISRMPEGHKYSIILNKLSQLCNGTNTSELVTWTGTLARKNYTLPVTFPSWPDVPQPLKEDGWKQINAKFDIPDSGKNWALEKLNGRWKGYKYYLKTDFYEKYDSDAERKANIDLQRMSKEQWDVMFKFWGKEENQAIVERNRNNKKKQKMRHTIGATSFPVMRDDMHIADPNQLPPSRIELFERTHTSKKTGAPIDPISTERLVAFKDCLDKESEESRLDKAVHESIFIDVMGRDCHGRVSLMRLGITPKELYGTQEMHQQTQAQELMELIEENKIWKEKVGAMEEKMGEMQSQMLPLTSAHQTMHSQAVMEVGVTLPCTILISLKLVFQRNAQYISGIVPVAYRRYGKVFKSHIFGNPTIISTDAEVSRFILQSDAKVFVPFYPSSLTELMGKSSILLINGSLQRRVHGLIGSFIKSPQLKARITQDMQSVQESMDPWKDNHLIYIQDETQNLMMQVPPLKII
ncbi:hypothetical protein NE237_015832 [Protea cynaroides]|uniref:Uncharacterized protein n=1 Tax=Protea cynaroides TaxID=273540 RepID=A0A9Q0KEQ9_9MAGN|nr:hypothetical protein NE237_015832 [Protea cynaroides]